MVRLGGWLGGSRSNASTQSLTSLDEPKALREAMEAASFIFADDVETAQDELSKGSSPFHKLGLGMVAFLKAIMGFEQDVMKEASERLADAEAASSEHRSRASRDAYKSAIYPPGAEYSLCYAESLIMSAVIGVLNESLTESIRGFYRLRKAYATLQEISDAEKRFLSGRRSSTLGASKRNSLDSAGPSSSRRSIETALPSYDDVEEEDLDFVDADEGSDIKAPTARYQGHIDQDAAVSQLQDLKIDPAKHHDQLESKIGDPSSKSGVVIAEEEEDIDALFEHPIDSFIHSGSNLCFGILQLMLGIIPPSFTRLLSIVGFRGDRDAGVSMLWRATRYNDINGAMAGLVTLGYYNGMVAFADIIGSGMYPKDRCRALLQRMRKAFPDSRLWLLEESRMTAGDRRLEDAVTLFEKSSTSPLKQIAALQLFETSLNCMYLHRFEKCASGFLKCIEMNSWSHGLYYYIAGSCYVELYREAKTNNDPKTAHKWASRATEILRGVPAKAAKKRFMKGQLPFEAFVTRKVAKWEARALELDVEFIDAIGVSPLEEMIYFSNGYKRMRPEHLQRSLECISWASESEQNTVWAKEGLDERAVSFVLTAAVTARLGDTEKSRRILREGVLVHEWASFKGEHRDSWTLPVAHYEMANNCWIDSGGENGDLKLNKECAEWIDKVAKWEKYDLDARVGIKVRMAQDTLRKCGASVA